MSVHRISPDFEHDVLVWDEPLPAVDGAPPPVVGHLPVQQDRVTLPEVDLPRRAGLEVVQRVRLQNFGLCKLETKLSIANPINGKSVLLMVS